MLNSGLKIVVCVICAVLFSGCSTDIVTVSSQRTLVSASATQTTAQLVAGRNTVMGTVNVRNDKNNLFIELNTIPGWFVEETKFHIATSLSALPQTRRGNPIPGKFEFKNNHIPAVQSHTYTIPLRWSEGTEIFIAFHAEVIGTDNVGNGNGNGKGKGKGNGNAQKQGAWAEGEGFPGSNWATYFSDEIDKTGIIIIGPGKP